MKQYTVYVCSKCGKESKDHDEIELCEAHHMGLQTLEEKHTYDSLKALASYCGSFLYDTNNERTREAFDNACAALENFEREHKMGL